MLKKSDIKLGLRVEYKLFKYLKKNNSDVVWLSQTNQYSMFDYKLNDIYIELKTRRYQKKRFDKNGHMIELSKFKWLKDNNVKKAYIFYCYYDGLYRATFKLDSQEPIYRIADGGRADREASVELKKVAYIHSKHLKLVNKNFKTPKDKSLEECII